MKEQVVQKDLRVWRSSSGRLQEALQIAWTALIREFEENPDLPVVALSQGQYDSGRWSVPKTYADAVRKMVLRVHVVMACRHGCRRYALSRGQRQYAFLEAAQWCQKLMVNGVLLPKQESLPEEKPRGELLA